MFDSPDPPVTSDVAPASARCCRVAVFSRPGDPHLIGSILCDILKEPATDAMIQSHYAPGVLPVSLTRDQAERIQTLIQGFGIQAAVVAAAELPRFEVASAVHHARCAAVGWELIDYRGDLAELVPWSDIDLIAVGEVPQSPVTRPADTDHSMVSSGPHHVTPLVDTAATTGPELWVVCRQPVRVYHIEHRAMNYESLREQKTESATTNFRRYVEQLVEHAGSAWKTPSTQAFLTRKAMSHYEFRDSAELQRQALLTWVMEQQVRTGR